MTDIDTDIFLSCSDGSRSSSFDESYVSFLTLAETVDLKFSDVSKNFNVVHINAQSIHAHYPDLVTSFDNKHVHAVLVSETFLKPCLSSTSYSLPGYELIRNDRIGARCGGVAIYLKTHIPYSVVSTSRQPPPDNAGEHLFIEVTLSRTKVLLGVYYSPDKNVNYFASFENLLEDLTPSYNHTIIMGDFNTCLLKLDHRTSKLKQLANSSNLTILPLNSTHHFPNCTPSLLDLMLVSSPNNVAKHGQCSADAFSYHDLIFLSYKMRPPKPKPQILLCRNFGGMDLEALRSDARDIDWSEVADAQNVNDKLAAFNTAITNLYDKHAPLRKIKIKQLPSPWLTEEIRSLMHKKNVAKGKWKRNTTSENEARYHKIRNHCNRVCRDALRRYIHESVENEDTSKVWKFLRSMGVGKSPSSSKLTKDLDMNSLNQHFTSSSNLHHLTKSDTLSFLSSKQLPNTSPFSFSQFSDVDVKRAIKSISSSAVGTDSISRNMILPIIDEILHVICNIFNNSVSTNSFPMSWKEAQIIPLPKKPNPSSFSEYRPISILPFLSKVLERLVHQQLSVFLSNNSLMNPFQSGFRPGHSTTTALVKITDDIRLGMDNQKLTVLTLLDFSNAFNNVDFDLLLGILRSLNICPSAIDWFHSYLYGRRQRIRIDENYSSWNPISAGVPQGGVLSPLLFAVYINTISTNLSSSYHLYADDLQIYTQAPLAQLDSAINRLNDDLKKICDWSSSYGLKVNPTKTQAIIIGSSRLTCKMKHTQLPPLVFNGTMVPFSTEVRNLGVTMDSNLTWDSQLAGLRQRMFASNASLRRLRNFLPTATKIMLAQTLLLPILDYADECFLDLTEAQLNRLERLQNLAIRFIYGLRKYDHVSEYRNKLKWLPIRLRRDSHVLSLLYRILFLPTSPCYLKSRFQFRHSPSKSVRSSKVLLLAVPDRSSTFYHNSFTARGVELWNALPAFVRQSKSLAVFKANVYKHYLALAEACKSNI